MAVETTTPDAGKATTDAGAGTGKQDANAGGATTTATPPAGAGGTSATGTPATTTTTTETKTQEGEKKPDAGADGGAKAPGTGAAPVEVKLPEGVVASADDIKAFSALAGELGLDSTKAQKIVDFQAALTKRAMEGAEKAGADARTAAREQTLAGWAKEIETDKELGGAKFEETKQLASKVMRAVGSPKLVAFLDESGLGSHPEMVRFFRSIGARMSEDTLSGSLATPKGAADTQDAYLRSMYPTMFKDE